MAADFTYTQQKNIIGNSRTCIGILGAKIAKGLANGKDMSSDENKLAYIFHLCDTICRFAPVGSVVDGITRTADGNNITQDEANVLINKLTNLCPCS